ncbi:unnamed protein product [Echinostoma caproni]|uniref:Endonuclease V n=1 Tax=Echinostoma caproni TaxID=27848 RepID=A0A183BET1_9TREM|nr:unnamed protein product [Echinostoma caproni]
MLNTNQSSNPVYVSPGHLISLETACEIVLRMSKFRTPEPTRLADQISRKKIRQIDENNTQRAGVPGDLFDNVMEDDDVDD